MLEIMTMIEVLIFVVITKYDSPCLPYVDVIRMLQSLYGFDNKKKANQRQKQASGIVL